MTKKSSPILTDTVIVIGAHNKKFWDLLRNRYQIAIPATILEDELFYFGSKNDKESLVPSNWIDEGIVHRAEAEVNDFKLLTSKLSPHFQSSLDPGELEALALMCSPKYKDYLFTTADRAAIKVLSALGLGSRGISAEALLENVGASKQIINSLPSHFTKKWFERCLQEGFLERDIITIK